MGISDVDRPRSFDAVALALRHAGQGVGVLKAFAALEPSAQAALEHDIISLIGRFNRSGDGSMVVPSEYLDVVVKRALPGV